MFKPLLFYTISDCVDDVEYCKSKRLKPHKTEKNMLDGLPIEVVVQYSKCGYIYDVLESEQCYSGYPITLMRLPKLSFDDLLIVAITSKHHEERAGAVGVILKDYSTEFEKYLLQLENDLENIRCRREKKKIARMVSYICHDVPNYTSYVWERKSILFLCKRIKTSVDR